MFVLFYIISMQCFVSAHEKSELTNERMNE